MTHFKMNEDAGEVGEDQTKPLLCQFVVSMVKKQQQKKYI